MYLGQGNKIRFVGSLICFHNFFLLDNCFGRWSQWMWLVSCRRQEMLTQGLTPDRKCELNKTSFLTVPHPVYCPIWSLYCCFKWWRIGKVGRWFIYVRVWVRGHGLCTVFFPLFVLFLCCCWLFFHDWYMIVFVSVSMYKVLYSKQVVFLFVLLMTSYLDV